ncbi:AAA family ATPase [Streptomyces sp. MAR4 CNX-425]|uniref:AAA family ATPase n=1 Tax=Streptomyces sp. MAR4 CNX-425 TaxID=3406343 RepID=UPI003B50328C
MTVEQAASRERLRYPAGDIVVISGLPGSGKSTLMRRTEPRAEVVLIDSQYVRERWARRLGRRLPYGLYRPLVRVDHYARLWLAVRAGGSLVVHDCGTLPWVRWWLTGQARRYGRGLHVVVLDIPAEVARERQEARGRAVSRYAFARHRWAHRRLLDAAGDGGLAARCASVLVLDGAAAGTLRGISFGRGHGG